MNSCVFHHSVWLFLSLFLTLAACTAEPETADRQDPPLLTAAENGDLPTIQRLTAENSAVDIRDACLWTPLMKAALNGHTQAVLQLIQANADVNLVDKGGYSALMLAASNNHAEIIDLLINAGASPDLVEQTGGFTAMIWSAKLGHTATIRQLISAQADATAQDFDGKSALDWAKEMKHAEIITLLSQYTE